ncbi:ABC transporter substrate-binding protein [Tessaracoccus lubricantis]|uniref:ABC transporter substrate-binding protein n=1 Tax=Tessaracoccus lubricantis TaxID=545543 RepID=A0ABP9F3V3_9ACTN
MKITSALTRRVFLGGLGVSALAAAGCGSGSTTEAPESTTPTTAGGEETTAAAGGTVTVWHYFSDPNQVALMDRYAELFAAANPGSKAENVFVPYDQMNSKLVSAVGAQEGPDIAVFNGAEAATLALAGALQPIDTFLNGYADADQLPSSVIHKLEDETFAVQGYVNLLGLWYNADILGEIGVEPPTTMDELEAAMDKAVAAGKQGITLCALPQGQGEWQAFPWLSSEGFDYAAPEAEPLAAGLARARGWVEKGYLSQEAVTWDQTVPFQQFAAGNVAFAENGNWQMGTAKSDAKFNYGVVALPLSDSGKVYLGGEGQGIGAFSKDPALAWKYLEASYLAVDGQLAAAEIVGSIPSRLDAAENDAVTSNELLRPFAETVAKFGANYPDAAIPPESVPDVQLTVGQAWSAVVGGQQSPEDAAKGVVDKLSSIVG